jgi:heat shock protein HtpX
VSPEPVVPPILIHDRIEANRRKTRFLQVIFPVAVFPAVLYASSYLMSVFAMAGTMVVSPASGSELDLAVRLTVAGLASVALVAAATMLVIKKSSTLMLRLTGARPIRPDGREEPVLVRVVENLCIGSGIPKPRVAVIESAAINAYSTGLDPETSTLVVTRGVLNALDRQELEGVVAQELSQIGNEEVRLGTMMAAVVTLLWLPYLILRRAYRVIHRSNPKIAVGCLILVGLWIGGPIAFSIVAGFELGVEMMRGAGPASTGVADGNPMIGVALIATMSIALYAFLGAPVLGLLIHRAVSREREHLADADAALLTRYPPGLARALTKIGVAGNATLDTEPSIAHLWIADPLSRGEGRRPGLWSLHPPIGERIAILSRMGGTDPAMLEKAEADGLRYWRRRSSLLALDRVIEESTSGCAGFRCRTC